MYVIWRHMRAPRSATSDRRFRVSKRPRQGLCWSTVVVHVSRRRSSSSSSELSVVVVAARFWLCKLYLYALYVIPVLWQATFSFMIMFTYLLTLFTHYT